MRPRLGMLVFLALLASVGASAQNDPQVGTWKLNLAKSTYSPGPPPKSGTVKITAASDGMTVVEDSVNAQGQAIHTTYTFKFDGKDYPRKDTIGGKPDTSLDAVAWKQLGTSIYQETDKLNGQVITTANIAISPDGKTRTRTVTGGNAQGQTADRLHQPGDDGFTVRNGQGQTVDDTAVYDKQ
jgi:hypothetical protein